MSQDAKLRLCPLCGSDKIKVDTLSDDCFKSGWWLVWCDQKQGGCSDASITRKTKEEAIFGWNNFHCWKLLDEKEKELAELKAAVKDAIEDIGGNEEDNDRAYRKLSRLLQSPAAPEQTEKA